MLFIDVQKPSLAKGASLFRFDPFKLRHFSALNSTLAVQPTQGLAIVHHVSIMAFILITYFCYKKVIPITDYGNNPSTPSRGNTVLSHGVAIAGTIIKQKYPRCRGCFRLC